MCNLCTHYEAKIMFTKCPKCGYEENENIYWQRNPRYKGLKLGNSNTSMQQYGCFLMCLSYVTRKDPIEVNRLLTEQGGYSGDMILTPKAFEILGLKYIKTERDINKMPEQEESIKEVLLGRSQHFTVRINKDGKRTIFDPWLGEVKPINYYPFRSYRIFNK